MALKLKPIKMNYGVEFKDLYFKITLVSYNDELKELSFAGACYLTEAAARGGQLQPIEGLRISGNFYYDQKDGNWLQAVYEYIKKQALSLKGKTVEDILRENDLKYMEAMSKNEAPQDIQDPFYLNFVDAQDC